MRSKASKEAGHLSARLDQDEVVLPIPVRLEILMGARRRDLPMLRDSLAALPVLYPAASTWDLVEVWIEKAAQAGERFGFADLLIGALASENGCSL